jgi:chaperone modulatory protein CbpM
MMQFEAVLTLFPDLDRAELTLWIEQRWVQPERTEGEIWLFHEIDVARARLIYDLRRELDTPEDTLPMLLGLLDQVYELRCTLKAMTRAIESQPAEVKAAVLGALRTGGGSEVGGR